MGLVQFVPRVISVQDNIADFNLPTSVHLDLLVEASEGGIFYIVSHVRAWQSHSCFPGIGNRFGHQVDAVIDGAKEWVYLQEVQNNGMSRVLTYLKPYFEKYWAEQQIRGFSLQKSLLVMQRRFFVGQETFYIIFLWNLQYRYSTQWNLEHIQILMIKPRIHSNLKQLSFYDGLEIKSKFGCKMWWTPITDPLFDPHFNKWHFK